MYSVVSVPVRQKGALYQEKTVGEKYSLGPFTEDINREMITGVSVGSRLLWGVYVQEKCHGIVVGSALHRLTAWLLASQTQ